MESWGLLFGMVAAVLVTGWIGYALARSGKVVAEVILTLIPAVIGAGFFIAAAGAQGWDALGYFLIAMVFCMPPAVGFGLGTLIGWLARPARPD